MNTIVFVLLVLFASCSQAPELPNLSTEDVADIGNDVSNRDLKHDGPTVDTGSGDASTVDAITDSTTQIDAIIESYTVNGSLPTGMSTTVIEDNNISSQSVPFVSVSTQTEGNANFGNTMVTIRPVLDGWEVSRRGTLVAIDINVSVLKFGPGVLVESFSTTIGENTTRVTQNFSPHPVEQTFYVFYSNLNGGTRTTAHITYTLNPERIEFQRSGLLGESELTAYRVTSVDENAFTVVHDSVEIPRGERFAPHELSSGLLLHTTELVSGANNDSFVACDYTECVRTGDRTNLRVALQQINFPRFEIETYVLQPDTADSVFNVSGTNPVIIPGALGIAGSIACAQTAGSQAFTLCFARPEIAAGLVNWNRGFRMEGNEASTALQIYLSPNL